MTSGRGATGLPLTPFARQMILDPKFRELWRVPVLVWEAFGRGAQAAEEASPDVAPTGPRAGEPLVFEARKAPGTTDVVRGIMVGRTSNNDIVINDASVSPFHAVLLLDEPSRGWTIGDAGSSTGTFVRGERLQTSLPVPLGEDVTLVMGNVALRFLSPPAFFLYLGTLETAPPAKAP